MNLNFNKCRQREMGGWVILISFVVLIGGVICIFLYNAAHMEPLTRDDDHFFEQSPCYYGSIDIPVAATNDPGTIVSNITVITATNREYHIDATLQGSTNLLDWTDVESVAGWLRSGETNASVTVEVHNWFWGVQEIMMDMTLSCGIGTPFLMLQVKTPKPRPQMMAEPMNRYFRMGEIHVYYNDWYEGYITNYVAGPICP